MKNTDTSMLKENEVFYVHKNRASSTFQIFTWSTNENFKYIDELWNSISEDISTLWEDLSSFEWDIYSQILWITTEDTSLIEENEVIRASIKRLIKK